MPSNEASPVETVGRYAVFDQIATGGMATVHFGRLIGPVGFSRVVAIKRLLPQFAADPDFVASFVDEARLASRIRDVHVVPTLDVVTAEGAVWLIMEYVHGVSLAHLAGQCRANGRPFPIGLASTIVSGTLMGLHAAHQATSESGQPLRIVHRDVSPQNVMLGTDGVARVLDFGVARAVARLQASRDGQVKGKLSYMAPEQLRGQEVGPFTDIFAAGIVLWELLAGRRLFAADNEAAIVEAIRVGATDPPGTFRPEVTAELDAIAMRALDPRPERRFGTALEMARALEPFCVPVTEVSAFVQSEARNLLAARAEALARIEANNAPLADAQQVVSEVLASKSKPGLARRRRLALVGGTLFLAAAGSAAFLAARPRTAPSVEEREPAAKSSPLSEADPPAPPPVAPAEAAPATPKLPAAPTPPAPDPEPVGTAAAAATPPQRVGPSTGATGSTTTPAMRRRAAEMRKKNCQPPYVRDSSGQVIWKRECI